MMSSIILYCITPISPPHRGIHTILPSPTQDITCIPVMASPCSSSSQGSSYIQLRQWRSPLQLYIGDMQKSFTMQAVTQICNLIPRPI